MYFARMATVVPVPGRQAEVEQHLDDLMAWLPTQKGFVLGMRFRDTERPEAVTSMGVFESRADGDRIATSQHLLSINSQIIALSRGRHVEWRTFEVPTLSSQRLKE